MLISQNRQGSRMIKTSFLPSNSNSSYLNHPLLRLGTWDPKFQKRHGHSSKKPGRKQQDSTSMWMAFINSSPKIARVIFFVPRQRIGPYIKSQLVLDPVKPEFFSLDTTATQKATPMESIVDVKVRRLNHPPIPTSMSPALFAVLA